jgi:hypothetical protein
MKHYYAFANGIPLIDRVNLKTMYYDLYHYYKDIGIVTVVDEEKNLIRTMNLIENRCVVEGMPNQTLVNALTPNRMPNDVIRPVIYGAAEPPKICF